MFVREGLLLSLIIICGGVEPQRPMLPGSRNRYFRFGILHMNEHSGIPLRTSEQSIAACSLSVVCQQAA